MDQENLPFTEIQMKQQQKQGLQQAQNGIIQNYKIIKERLFEIPNCSICLNQLFNDICALECGHVFHKECIKQNFQHRQQCPMCKSQIDQDKIVSLFYPLTEREYFVRRENLNDSQSNLAQKNVWKLNYRNLLSNYQNLKFKFRKVSSSNLLKVRLARQSRKLKNQLQKSNMKIQILNKQQTQLRQQIRKNDRTISQKNKQIQQKDIFIQNLKYLIKRQRQQIQIEKNLLQKKIQKLQKQNLKFCLQLQKAIKQLDKNQEIKNFLQVPEQFVNNFKSKLQNTSLSIEQSLKQCQQIVIFQNAQLRMEKTKNDNLNEQIKNQSKLVDELNKQIKDQFKEQKSLQKKYKQLQIAYNQSQKECSEYINRLNITVSRNSISQKMKPQNHQNINMQNNNSSNSSTQMKKLNLNLNNKSQQKSLQKDEPKLKQLKIPSLFATSRPYGGIKLFQHGNKKMKE